MKVNCQDYRKSMQLLSLKAILEKGVANPTKQKELEERILKLEKELKID